jgi:sugar diacid utilization regulator
MPMDAIERFLGIAFDSSRPRGMVAVVDGDVAVFIDHFPRGKLRTAIGIGPPARLDGLEPSFRRATRAMATAAAFDMTGVYDLGGLGLLPAVLADNDVAEEVTRRYIAPLTTSEGTRPILETVHRYLQLGMRADATAQHLSVHHNTVRYRVRRYEELTGVDLRDPNCALEAWWALQRTRLEHSPADPRPDPQITTEPAGVRRAAVAGQRAP